MAKKRQGWSRQVSWQMALAVLLLIGVPLSIMALVNFQGVTGRARDPGAVMEGRLILPSGPQYSLTLIGAPSGKEVPTAQAGWMVVPLQKPLQVAVNESEAFAVADGNGSDGWAALNLPNPDPTNEGNSDYALWVRSVAKAQNGISRPQCGIDALSQEWCTGRSMVSVKAGQTNDVAKQLMYVYADVDNNGTSERYYIFDDALQDLFWQYDNQGMKIAHLRLYQVMADEK